LGEKAIYDRHTALGSLNGLSLGSQNDEDGPENRNHVAEQHLKFRRDKLEVDEVHQRPQLVVHAHDRQKIGANFALNELKRASFKDSNDIEIRQIEEGAERGLIKNNLRHGGRKAF